MQNAPHLRDALKDQLLPSDGKDSKPLGYQLPEAYKDTPGDIRLAHINLQRALASTENSIKRRRKAGGQEDIIESFFEPTATTLRGDLAALEEIVYTAAADAFARRRAIGEQRSSEVTP
ncbi:hypothetical protein Lxx07650 [Leifsonia xyli subsp. xyli str. CTCB07]|uniref:Uncharacterized protein n=2 Tax=Leifsonia xyli subsp. xyli TaxID=59736 RepID=Q6AG14_LEIXX|nr:hypothetical protein Lxx07650 [Leifsonia xyli subsp. xyli str. CTCB07]